MCFLLAIIKTNQLKYGFKRKKERGGVSNGYQIIFTNQIHKDKRKFSISMCP